MDYRRNYYYQNYYQNIPKITKEHYRDWIIEQIKETGFIPYLATFSFNDTIQNISKNRCIKDYEIAQESIKRFYKHLLSSFVHKKYWNKMIDKQPIIFGFLEYSQSDKSHLHYHCILLVHPDSIPAVNREVQQIENMEKLLKSINKNTKSYNTTKLQRDFRKIGEDNGCCTQQFHIKEIYDFNGCFNYITKNSYFKKEDAFLIIR